MKTLNINNNFNNFKILDERVGDILNKFPMTKDFFEKYDIDYCCNGRKFIKDALNELNINNATIINELISYTTKETSKFKLHNTDQIIESTTFVDKSSEEIIDFVLDYFHEGLRKDLPKTHELMLKIMRAHIKEHKDLFWKVHELFCKIQNIFDSHLILEEENIFKNMIKFNNNEITRSSDEYKIMIKSIEEAMNEHFIVGPTLKELSILTNDYTVPKNSCKTVEEVYDRLVKLQEHILAHTQIENNILFPRYLN